MRIFHLFIPIIIKCAYFVFDCEDIDALQI
jgi:hypothetical protein